MTLLNKYLPERDEKRIEHLPLHVQIRAKRREKNISQLVLAIKANISIDSIRKLEQGRNVNISLKTFVKISKALDYYDWDLNLLWVQF